MKERVALALDAFQEGGTIVAALQAHGLGKGTFYDVLDNEPDLENRYRRIQKNRADLYIDEAYSILTDKDADPRRVRAVVDGLVKLAGLYDRLRYGERVQIDVNNQIDLRVAIADARARLQPLRNLGAITDAQFTEVSALIAKRETDKQSVEATPGLVDPFSD